MHYHQLGFLDHHFYMLTIFFEFVYVHNMYYTWTFCLYFFQVIFTRDLKWCPTFDKLKNLILNDYWCMGPSFDALSCILKHSPVLEKLSLHLFKVYENCWLDVLLKLSFHYSILLMFLVSQGLRANVKMKGSYSSMERSSVISEHLKVVDVKCSVVDENVVEVLKFLCTLNIRKLTGSTLHALHILKICLHLS